MPYYIGDVIKESKKLVIRTPEEFKKTGIDVKIKTRVDHVDPQKGSLSLSDGTSLPYDFLVMATGAEAVRLDIPGRDLEGVYVFRNLTDGLKMKSYRFLVGHSCPGPEERRQCDGGMIHQPLPDPGERMANRYP